MEHLDLYLSRTLKKGLTKYEPPANAKAILLSQAAQLSKRGVFAWSKSKKVMSLYRVHVNRSVGWSEHLDCLMAVCSLELSISQQHLVT